MSEENVINKDNFEMLLNWLDRNRETAAQKYEKIRQRLIRIFTARGCFEAEELADETFNRVTKKLPQIANSYTGDAALYFYGVADKIHLEWLRKQKKIKELNLTESVDAGKPELEIEYECLDACLGKLPVDQHKLIVEYYAEEKSAKIEKRREIAKSFGLSISGLQVKAFRIRSQLKDCVQNCINKKKLL